MTGLELLKRLTKEQLAQIEVKPKELKLSELDFLIGNLRICPAYMYRAFNFQKPFWLDQTNRCPVFERDCAQCTRDWLTKEVPNEQDKD